MIGNTLHVHLCTFVLINNFLPLSLLVHCNIFVDTVRFISYKVTVQYIVRVGLDEQCEKKV